MKRTIIFTAFLFIIASQVLSQDRLRVAVFDPSMAGRFEEAVGITVREMVSSAIVNTKKYIIIERSLINKILEEQKFSNSGAVDEKDASALGKLAGANKVILCVLTVTGERAFISLKMIDVSSASVERQKTKLVRMSELLDVIMPLAADLVHDTETSQTTPSYTVPNQTSANKTNDRKESQRTETKKTEPAASAQESTTKRDYSDRVSRVSGADNYSSSQLGADSFILLFPGYAAGKNPVASIFVDGKLAGRGDLQNGFSISVQDAKPGTHKVKITWSGTVPSQSYTINTAARRRFAFEYVKTGFGYVMNLKND